MLGFNQGYINVKKLNVEFFWRSALSVISVYDGAYSVYHEPMQPSYKKAKFMRLETVAAQVKPSNGKKNISDMKKQASNFG